MLFIQMLQKPLIGLVIQVFFLFFKSHLIDRQSYILFRRFKSFEFTSTSDVPQGSNLEPLFFILFKNDVTSQFNPWVHIYVKFFYIWGTFNFLVYRVICKNSKKKN